MVVRCLCKIAYNSIIYETKTIIYDFQIACKTLI